MKGRARFFTPVRIVWLAALVLAIILPSFISSWVLSLMVLACIWIIVTISMNLLYGYTGQLSLGHAAFLGIGAYSFALLTVEVGLSYWPAFFVSIAITGVAGVLIGFPALRVKGPYFVLVTIAFAVIINLILLAWTEVTKGANGISGIPRPPAIPLPFGSEIGFSSQVHMYYLILFFLVLIALINERLVHSLVGRTFIAISWDEDLAQSIGVNTMRRKLLSFTISAIYTGIAGILYASYNSVITPHLAHFIQGMNSVVFLVVGGAATMAGPFVGTLVMTAIPEVLQVLPILKIAINGFVLLIFIIFLPTGIVGGFRLLVSRLRRPKHKRMA